MKLLKNLAIALSVIGLAACAGAQTNAELEALNGSSATGTPFTKYLTAEYRAFANQEYYDEKDFVDGIHFGRKGLASARGENVMPEPVEDWNLSQALYLELGEAREMLVTVLENGARELVANKAAAAQARFDCWVETQEENWNAETRCEKEFYQLLNELQSMVKPPPPPVAEAFPAPIEPIPAPEPVQVEEALFIVFFDWDKSNLTGGANEVVDATVAEIQNRTDVSRIIVTGHTDTSGPDAYNEKLSMRRAQAVKTALVARGINEDMIVLQARGESELLVDTPDDVREPANRRTQISLE